MTAHVVPMLDWPCAVAAPVLVVQPVPLLQPVPVPVVTMPPAWGVVPDIGSMLKQAMQSMPVDFQHSAQDPTRRILCYGDSLTAGFFAGGHKFDPYGRTMSEALAAAGISCQVTVCGHSGATSREMLEASDSQSQLVDALGCRGDALSQILDRRFYDLVIIMSGTNDMGLGTEIPVIAEDVQRLHSICHDRGIPTVALAPPPAPSFPEQELQRQLLVGELRNFCLHSAYVREFIDPAEIMPVVHGQYWDPDGLHFAPAGSQALGLALASLLLQIGEVGCP